MPYVSKNIVYAERPKRSVTALSPKEIEKRKHAEALLAKAPRVVDHNKSVPEVDPEACREAADRPWRDGGGGGSPRLRLAEQLHQAEAVAAVLNLPRVRKLAAGRGTGVRLLPF